MTAANIYEELGVAPLINAQGTFTDLGGSLMSPEVIDAWTQAARHFVDLRELQDRVGERIAQLLKVEAALVTGGAASGILLGTAAAITLKDDRYVSCHWVSNPPYEVLRQTGQRDVYDRQVETCGVRLVDVDSLQDAEQKISKRTVLMMAYNLHEPNSNIKHQDWLQLATKHSIPTLLDAAADVPPVKNLWRYCHMGYDLVTFSGGKAIGGPQGTGLLLGRRNCIEAAQQNAIPIEGTVGRVAKVSKEDIVALWQALKIFVQEGDQIRERCQSQLQTIISQVNGLPSMHCEVMTPEVANHFPHLRIRWDESKMGLTPAQLACALRSGSPPIATGHVDGTGIDGLLISAINLQPGEEEIVAARICEVFAL